MQKLLEGPLEVLETSTIPFLPNAPHKAKRNHLPNDGTHRATSRPPARKKILNITRHHPAQTKTHEDGVPQSLFSPTMKENMVNRLPLHFTQATFVNHNHTSFPKIVHGRDLTKHRHPNKESHSRGSLSPPNALPRKRDRLNRSKGKIKRSHLELSFVRRNPPKLVRPFPPQIVGIQPPKQRSQSLTSQS
jgi:hypothetical protein